MTKFHAIWSKNVQQVHTTKSAATVVRRSLAENKIVHRYKSFFHREDAEYFAGHGMTKIAASRALEELFEMEEEYCHPNIPEVYTDGACSKKGKTKYAGAGVYWGTMHPLNEEIEVAGEQTNQRAELTAIMRAIAQARTIKIKKIHIKTDSQYSIDTIGRIDKWKKRGWTNKGQAVANKDILKEIEKMIRTTLVRFSHVEAHCGIKGNEEADKLAVRARIAKENKMKNNKNSKTIKRTNKKL